MNRLEEDLHPIRISTNRGEIYVSPNTSRARQWAREYDFASTAINLISDVAYASFFCAAGSLFCQNAPGVLISMVVLVAAGVCIGKLESRVNELSHTYVGMQNEFTPAQPFNLYA